MEAEITSQAVGLSSTDFSIIKLFVRADIIVKSVILILIAASIYSWAIIFDKYKLFKKINLPMNLKINFGNLNLLKLFTTVYPQTSKIQWLKFLKILCKVL